MTCEGRRDDSDVVVGCIAVAARGRDLEQGRGTGSSSAAIYNELEEERIESASGQWWEGTESGIKRIRSSS